MQLLLLDGKILSFANESFQSTWSSAALKKKSYNYKYIMRNRPCHVRELILENPGLEIQLQQMGLTYIGNDSGQE